MSGTEEKTKASSDQKGENQPDNHDELINPDGQIYEGQLDGNDGDEYEETKNAEDDKNQEGENENHDNPQDHQEGEEGGIVKISNFMKGQNDQTNEIDLRSVYVKNVDYSATKEEVNDFFKSCGKINRISIIKDKYTGNPKGFAYIEFDDKEGADNAQLLNDSTFKGRTLEVAPKRTNIPSRGRGRGRGRGGMRFMGIRRGFTMFTKPKRGRGYRPY